MIRLEMLRKPQVVMRSPLILNIFLYMYSNSFYNPKNKKTKNIFVSHCWYASDGQPGVFSTFCICCFSSIVIESPCFSALLQMSFFGGKLQCCLTPFVLFRKPIQTWQPSAVQTQLLPWTCFTFWAKKIPVGTSLSPRLASAQPWLWFIWELKETQQLRWLR